MAESIHSPLRAGLRFQRRQVLSLYFCTFDGVGREGVAVSASPYGPFVNPVPVEGADGGGIDPAVLVDDDGQAYLYWGQFNLQGAKLNASMTGIVPGTQRTLLTEAAHGFHEGACIRKVNGHYILVYADVSRGKATCLGHAVADSPLGVYTKKGIIIDNSGCDKRSWNIHGSICKFREQWYVFYHRSSLSSRFSRRACCEPITIQSDGSITEVEMTTQGAGPPLDATSHIAAYRACTLFGDMTTRFEDGDEFLTGGTAGDFAGFKTISFMGQTCCTVLVKGKGRVSISLDQPFHPPVGTIEVNSEYMWTATHFSCQELHGTHNLYLIFHSGDISVKEFYFRN
ncbi:MAG: hypothetical protein E4H27_02650 [Anaerolineales bacterium]|nr:MAG: hypothetical protein E4H27_02650 [Anaerolineales bacterium]